MIRILMLKNTVKLQARGLSLLISKVIVGVASYLMRLRLISMNNPNIGPTNCYLQYTRESFLGLRIHSYFYLKKSPSDGHKIRFVGYRSYKQIWEVKEYISLIENIRLKWFSTPIPCSFESWLI